MLKPERHHKIVSFVNTKEAATVDELAEELCVSKATVRRDLEQLHREKAVLRTHGGATMYNEQITYEMPINIRTHLHKDEKELVAEAAASLIKEESTIFVAPGTTARALAAKLGRFQYLTVLTNDIDVAKEVSSTDNVLIVTGGQLKKNSSTLYGFFTEQMLQGLKVDTVFMTIDAVDTENGFMDFGVDEINIKRMIIRNANRCVIMCDVSKFETSALVNICPLSAANIVVTNAEITPQDKEKLEKSGIEVVCAPECQEKKDREVTSCNRN